MVTLLVRVILQHRQSHDIDKALHNMYRSAWEPFEKIKHSNYNGMPVIRAFERQDQCIEIQKKAQVPGIIYSRLHTCVYMIKDGSERYIDLAIEMLILYGAMSQRGPDKAVALMIAMDYIHRFRHTVSHLMHSKKRNEERLKKL